ncbi:MAG: D-Ala-D-Ala carboxypeptidase family metallohydrolase [Vampirovibrionales bacterium]|nr:D-Ala-D-Ala carboxypeptidase family metallohydrolase [Vampirovibrionales bacterium]
MAESSSKKKLDPDLQLAPNFYLREFLPDGVLPEALPKPVLENLRRLATQLQALRNGVFNGRAIRISPNGGGYRTRLLNQQLGGAPHSFHLQGMAADINVAGLSPRQVQSLLKAWPGGLGAYPGHTHVDFGPHRRWAGVYNK